jgi:hypothetical protein
VAAVSIRRGEWIFGGRWRERWWLRRPSLAGRHGWGKLGRARDGRCRWRVWWRCGEGGDRGGWINTVDGFAAGSLYFIEMWLCS